MWKLPKGNQVDFLMIGKTGHGKSSTGNSILGRKEFETSADPNSVTRSSSVAWTEIDGRVIKVVDAPGVCDTDLKTDDGLDQAITAFSEAIVSCLNGFHALLLVIKFGTRMTKEEEKAIALLKKIFGNDILKDHVICVLTCGDQFWEDEDAKKMGFARWCRLRTGFFRELLQECNYRCVLFDNKSKDPKVRKTQLIQLIAHVEGSKIHLKRYTDAIFESAKRKQQQAIEKQKMKLVREELMRDMQLYLITFTNMSERVPDKNDLMKLKEKVDNLLEETEEKKSERDQLQDLHQTVSDMVSRIGKRLHAIDRPGDVSTDMTAAEGAVGDQRSDIILMRLHSDFLKQFERQKLQNDELKAQMTGDVKEQVKAASCFPGSSSVTLASGECILMEELEIGDRVVVRDGKGDLSIDVVYMFGHKDPQAFSEFVVLKTATQSVSVTKGHYVYWVQDGKEMCLAAENVQCGDFLLTMSSDGLMSQPVMSICYERKRGLFAPFTLSGNIVVDQALMSCYIDVLPASTCHTLLWPVRQLYRLSPRALAFVNGSASDHPIPGWAKAALRIL